MVRSVTLLRARKSPWEWFAASVLLLLFLVASPSSWWVYLDQGVCFLQPDMCLKLLTGHPFLRDSVFGGSGTRSRLMPRGGAAFSSEWAWLVKIITGQLKGGHCGLFDLYRCLRLGVVLASPTWVATAVA